MQISRINTAEYRKSRYEESLALLGGALGGLLAKEIVPVSKNIDPKTILLDVSEDVVVKSKDIMKTVSDTSPENAKILKKAFRAGVKATTRPTLLFMALGAGIAMSIVTIKNSLENTERFYIDALREEQQKESGSFSRFA